MDVEKLLEEREEEQEPKLAQPEEGESFRVLARARLPEILFILFLNLGLAFLSILMFVSNSVEGGLILSGITLSLGGFVFVMFRRLGYAYHITQDELIFRRGREERRIPLLNARLEPAIWLSKAEGDFESAKLVTPTGVHRLPLPDRVIQGDLVRERFIASLSDAGVEIRLPGYLPPKSEVKETDLVVIPGSHSGMGCIGGMIAFILLALSSVFGGGVILGLSSILFLILILVPVLIGLVINANRGQGKGRTIVFAADRLTSVRGKEVEWEVPREMLQGIIVESRRLPFKNTEVRVIAKTLYQRNLVMIDWTPHRIEARTFLLAHARVRGIPVEIRKGGDEPGDGSLLPKS